MNNSGILLLHKKSDVTSFQALYPVKKIINKKVGHTGTLDKFAEGLLVVLTGSMTKLNSLFTAFDKKYTAEIKFGERTDTLDPEGAIVATGLVPDYETVVQSLLSFQGEITQKPPIFSAIHVNGKRAYKSAREGEHIEIPLRNISIYSLELKNWDPPFATIDVHCSKGTYIRSLARDIGFACNSEAYVTKLIRTQVGPFSLDEAVKEENIKADSLIKDWNALKSVGCIGKIIVNDLGKNHVLHGILPDDSCIISFEAFEVMNYLAVFSKEDELLCVVEYNQSQQKIEKFVFVVSESAIGGEEH